MTGSVEESPDLREAWMLLFQGEVKQAAARFQAELGASDGASAAAGLLLSAAVMGAGDAVAALLADRWTRRRDAGLVLWRAAWICAVNGSDRGLDRLKTALDAHPAEAKEHAVLHYAEGHMAMLRGEENAALTHFLAARTGFAADPEWFLAPRDDALTSVFFQTSHLTGEDRLAAMIGGLDVPAGENGSRRDPIVMAAADGVYLRRFGADFLKALNDSNPGLDVTLLAIDAAEADAAGLADAAPALALDIRYEAAGFDGIARPPVYASWRFLRMANLLAEVGRPVLVLDIDVAVKAPLTPFFGALADGADFGCWFRPDGGPGGILWAGVTAFAPTPGGRWMAALAASCIRARFEAEKERLWFVDQTALWQASHAARRRIDGFRQADFADLGAPEDFLIHARDDGTKRR